MTPRGKDRVDPSYPYLGLPLYIRAQHDTVQIGTGINFSDKLPDVKFPFVYHATRSVVLFRSATPVGEVLIRRHIPKQDQSEVQTHGVPHVSVERTTHTLKHVSDQDHDIRLLRIGHNDHTRS